MQAADFEVCVTSGDSPWRPVGAAWVNVDGSILLITDWSPELLFMLVPARDAQDPARLMDRRRPDETDPFPQEQSGTQ